MGAAQAVQHSRDTTLDLGSSNLKKVPCVYKSHPALTHLCLSHNRLRTLPNSLWKLESLEILDASCNHLTSLPAGVSRLWRLEKLLLGDNWLESIPHQLSQCDKLHTLNISGNTISDLPLCLESLTSLTSLAISHCSITLDLYPAAVAFLTNLTNLDICNNRCGELASSGWLNMKAPKEPTDGVWKPTQIDSPKETVRPELFSLPPAKGCLDMLLPTLMHLSVLDVGTNTLSVLPEMMSRLTNLTLIKAEDNQLESLPDLSGCSALHSMMLAHNQLTSVSNLRIPQATLIRLDLRKNRIAVAPTPVEIASILREGPNSQLRLSGNPCFKASQKRLPVA